MKEQKFTDYDLYTEHVSEVIIDTISKVYEFEDCDVDSDMMEIQIDNWCYTIDFPESLEENTIAISSGSYLHEESHEEEIIEIPYTDSTKIIQTICKFHSYNQAMEEFIGDSLDSLVEKYPKLAPAIIENYLNYD